MPMAKALITIVKKEIKEIVRDPRLFLGMILVPILMFPIMGFAMQGIISEAQESTLEDMNIAILNLDKGEIGGLLINSTSFKYSLKSMNVTPIYLNQYGINDRNEAIAYIGENGSIPGLIVLPENLTYCINNQKPVIIEIYQVMSEKMSFAELNTARVSMVIQILDELISAYVISSTGNNLDPIFVKHPTQTTVNTVYKGNIIENVSPETIQGMISFQLFMMPIASMMLLIIAIQFAATSVASEKEQKTLETLLTLPISRTSIVIGKLTGSLLLSVVGTIGYSVGFQYYMSSITQQFPKSDIDLASLGLGIDLIGYSLIAGSLFLSLLTTLALVTVLASFAEDVRTAQSLSGILILPVTLGSVFGILAVSFGLSPEWLIALLLIPFTNPVLVPVYILQKDYMIVIISLIILIIETILSIKLAATFYSSEKILSAKLSLGKKKRKIQGES